MAAYIHDLLNPGRPFGAVIIGILCLAGAIIAARSLRLWADRLNDHSKTLIDPTAISFFGRLAQVVCFLLALIIYAHMVPALQRLGQAMLASAGLISLVVGLAAQNTLGNLIAGFSLLLYRPFGIGDLLTINTPTGKETGTVEVITLGYTKLMTDDKRWIIVPNSVIASNIVIRVK